MHDYKLNKWQITGLIIEHEKNIKCAGHSNNLKKEQKRLRGNKKWSAVYGNQVSVFVSFLKKNYEFANDSFGLENRSISTI